MPTRILMVGNSFSQDTMMYAPAAARSAGAELCGYDLYIGGCTLEQHMRVLAAGTNDYIFEHFTDTPEQKGLYKYTLDEGLAYMDWDIITFQQGSPKSGLPESYHFLDPLYAHVKEKMAKKAVRYAWNMTWAYAMEHNYGCNQMNMYHAIYDTVDAEIRPRGLDVIPTGIAVQAARLHLPDAALTRDNFHLSLTVGRYTAALTLVYRLMDIDPALVTFRPEGVSEREADICRAAARYAVDMERLLG